MTRNTITFSSVIAVSIATAALVPVQFASAQQLQDPAAAEQPQFAQGQVTLYFRLIEASGLDRRDPALADLDTMLRGMFRFNGYRLLSESVLAASGNSVASQILSAPSEGYQLLVALGDTGADGGAGVVTMTVQLNGEPRANDGIPISSRQRLPGLGTIIRPVSYTQALLSTTVTVSNGETVVLGSTQPGGGMGALILVVRSEARGHGGD